MAELKEITTLLSATLELERFSDASLNGLQIEGNPTVTKVAVAVDTGLATIEKAIAQGAQLLIVHHGLIWDKPFEITGSKKKIIEKALNNGLSLYAAHLPLDAHPTLGNNALLATLLGVKDTFSAFTYYGSDVGLVGTNNSKSTLKEIEDKLYSLPGTQKIMSLCFGPKIPKRVAIVSGSGSDALYEFSRYDFDTLITGEPRQAAYHFCLENELNAVFAGHYRTETVGVRALGDLITTKFGIESVFIDHPTGI
jgi:dinuclear metal center YbgI/SA1388 family protein